jgi:hypothetical protein
MIYSAADNNSNERDKVVINPVYIEKKTDKLKKIRNKTSKNGFCYSYGIYIVMAALLTALIAFNIALYKRVSEEMNSNMKFLFSLPFGIQNNISISRFAGFVYAYNKPYSHETTVTEMDEIKNSCSLTTILCLGGRDNISDIFLVVSCGYCSVVLSKTAKNIPTLHNGAYWYYSDVNESRSMGFAPNSNINQTNADIVDTLNNQRVSWHINGHGWRLGSLTHLEESSDYNKVIIRKDL